MSKKLKIGVVTCGFSYKGGWGTLSVGIVDAIYKKHDVVALTAKGYENDPTDYEVHGVLPSLYIKYGFFPQIQIFLQCLKYFRKCDIIHTFVEPFTPGAALASLVLRKPLVMTLAGTYSIIPKGNSPSQILKRALMKFMYKRASFIATGSMRNIELIEEVMSLNGKWGFIPFGVDPNKYKELGEYKKPEKPFLLTVGTVKPRKGADYVIKALGQIKDKLPNLHYKVAGSCDESHQFVKKLRKLIKENGLEGRVELLGRVTDEELVELYSTCTTSVLAAQTIDGHFEGFPMVFYEAHSLGAPIISTYGFGSEYVIKNGYNGYLVPEEDFMELSKAIENIAGNRELREKMSKNGKIEAKKHSWDNIGKYYLKAYNDVLS